MSSVAPVAASTAAKTLVPLNAAVTVHAISCSSQAGVLAGARASRPDAAGAEFENGLRADDFGAHEQGAQKTVLERAEETLTEIYMLFSDADRDGSGTLDRAEIIAVIKNYHKTEGTQRSAAEIQKEVDAAVRRYANPGTDSLSMHQFIEMLFAPDGQFKVKTPAERHTSPTATQMVE